MHRKTWHLCYANQVVEFFFIYFSNNKKTWIPLQMHTLYAYYLLRGEIRFVVSALLEGEWIFASECDEILQHRDGTVHPLCLIPLQRTENANQNTHSVCVHYMLS